VGKKAKKKAAAAPPSALDTLTEALPAGKKAKKKPPPPGSEPLGTFKIDPAKAASKKGAGGGGGGGRADLMAQLASGSIRLKKVDRTAAGSPQKMARKLGPQEELMLAIRGGVQLKKAETDLPKFSEVKKEEEESLTNSLQAALNKRRGKMQKEESSGSEWSDSDSD
jgi:hypothetical protein